MTTTETTSPRIYVACLAAYNNGRLHGAWIDADQDADGIWAEINAMLAASPIPGAEEWAIHDYEGFWGLDLGEYENLEDVAVFAEAIEEYGEAMTHYINDRGREYVELQTLGADFEGAFVGHYDSLRDFAESTVEELGFGGLTPDQIEGIWGFVDWDHIAHELTITDYWCADARELGGGVYVFRRD